jgi:hypothetical protein
MALAEASSEGDVAPSTASGVPAAPTRNRRAPGPFQRRASDRRLASDVLKAAKKRSSRPKARFAQFRSPAAVPAPPCAAVSLPSSASWQDLVAVSQMRSSASPRSAPPLNVAKSIGYAIRPRQSTRADGMLPRSCRRPIDDAGGRPGGARRQKRRTRERAVRRCSRGQAATRRHHRRFHALPDTPWRPDAN